MKNINKYVNGIMSLPVIHNILGFVKLPVVDTHYNILQISISSLRVYIFKNQVIVLKLNVLNMSKHCKQAIYN